MEQDEKMQQDDLISKRAAISEIDELFRLYNKTLRPDESNAAFEAMSRIKQLQTVDAVPVIQFKDGGVANRLFCTSCGLQMRSSIADSNGEWIKSQWRKVFRQ